MIGCIVVGGLVALAVGKIARHHARGGWCYRGPMRGGFGGDPFGWPGHGHGNDNGDEWPDGGGGGGHWGHPGGHAWFGHRWLGGHSFRFGWGPGAVLAAMLRRLETTPTQNQALRAAVKEFQASAKAAKGEGRRTRADVAEALRRPAIDAESMGEMFARHDSALEDLRKAFVGTMIKVHDVLDETQRERLAQLMEQGPRWFRGPTPGMSTGAW